MALILPPKFNSDIQGRDTALIPIIQIGSIYISTNSLTYDGNHVLPLLTSDSSLKESIDIEKRNYKISNISLTISNFPYEGQRFSERVVGSLINESVNIYWISPSTTTLGEAFLIYKGNVRKYDHSDTVCKITVEDRSQATLHKDLPIANLGTSSAVPDKYKNKPIPMVYGHVDRSPCVIKTQSELLIDSDETISGIIEDVTYEYADKYIQSGLYCYDNIFANITKLTQGLGSNNYQQWNSTNNKITFNTYLYGSNAELLSSLNLIELEYIAKPDKITSRDWSDNVGMGGDPMLYVSNAQNVLDLNPNNYAELSGDNLLIAITNNLDSSPALAELAFEFNNHFGLELSQTRSSFLINVELVTSIYSSVTPNINQEDAGGMRWNINIVENNGMEGAATTKQIYLFNDGLSDDGQDGGLADQKDGRYNNASNYDISNATNFEVNVNNNDPIEWSNLNNALPSMTRMAVQGNYQGTLPLQLRFAAIGWKVIGTFEYKNFAELDFYANVDGRIANPEAWEIIAGHENSIGVTELGMDIADDPGGGYDWVYAFTVNKKINSKKLIEGIASVSPYIPRFNNMGEFKLDVIKKKYEFDDTSDNHKIKEVDVIDFSFSRTKIEDVYTKIEFKYNWDYARDEFSDSVIADIYEIIPQYQWGYYGFPEPTFDEGENRIHIESTLVIDDDRGKYIRVEPTAKAFAEWYLMWSCNQHLKIKVKLPLKYMDLEIGDMVKFDSILGGVKPYGIDYVTKNDSVNMQNVWKVFIITSTSKTLNHVEIECIQTHNLSSEPATFGCADVDACNYEEGVVDNDTCWYANDGCSCDDAQDAVVDDCDICGGNNTSMDECGVCLGDNSTCADCDGIPNGNTPIDCDGVCGGSATIDDCGVCGGDCFGLTNGHDYPCQDPQGDWEYDCNHQCAEGVNIDCTGECGGSLEYDQCNNCGGNYEFFVYGTDFTVPSEPEADWAALIGTGTHWVDGGDDFIICDCYSNFLDCAGVCGGSAYIDPNCGDGTLCVGGNTGLSPCVQDCNNEWGGTATEDICGDCGGSCNDLDALIPQTYTGDDEGCSDCGCLPIAEDWCGCPPNQYNDNCGDCGGDNSSCLHCNDHQSLFYDDNWDGSNDACMQPRTPEFCPTETYSGFNADNWICDEPIWSAFACTDGVLNDNVFIHPANGSIPWADMQEYCLDNYELCSNPNYMGYPILLQEEGHCTSSNEVTFEMTKLELQNAEGIFDITEGGELDLSANPDFISTFPAGFSLKVTTNLTPAAPPIDIKVRLNIALLPVSLAVGDGVEDYVCFGSTSPDDSTSICADPSQEGQLEIEIGGTSGSDFNIDILYEDLEEDLSDWYYPDELWELRFKLTVEHSDTQFINYDETIEMSRGNEPYQCTPGEYGNLNQDEGWNVLDVVILANCVLAGNCQAVAPCGDMNGDGGYNVLDIVTLVNCVLDGDCPSTGMNNG